MIPRNPPLGQATEVGWRLHEGWNYVALYGHVTQRDFPNNNHLSLIMMIFRDNAHLQYFTRI
jgi:hypothetical protein